MVRSIAGSALDRNALCALDLEVCARSHVTTPISHNAGKLTMAARATWKTREYVACAQSWFLGSSAGALERIDVCSIIVALDRKSCAIERTARDYDSFFAQFHPFKSHFKPRTYDKIKY
jgi:hypothetical protein